MLTKIAKEDRGTVKGKAQCHKVAERSRNATAQQNFLKLLYNVRGRTWKYRNEIRSKYAIVKDSKSISGYGNPLNMSWLQRSGYRDHALPMVLGSWGGLYFFISKTRFLIKGTSVLLNVFLKWRTIKITKVQQSTTSKWNEVRMPSTCSYNILKIFGLILSPVVQSLLHK